MAHYEGRGSPTPVADDKIHFRVICWCKNGLHPEVMMFENVRGSKLELTNSQWLRGLCKGNEKAVLAYWSTALGDWAATSLDHLVVDTERCTLAVLIRLAGVTSCPGLGLELSLLEQARGRYTSPKLNEFDLTRKGGGRRVAAVVWNQRTEDEATLYQISLASDDTFTISSYAALLHQTVGVCALPTTSGLFEVWDVKTERWTAKKVGEDIGVPKGHELVLLRHPANNITFGLGAAVEQLQLERVMIEKQEKQKKNSAKSIEAPPAKKRRIVNPARGPSHAAEVIDLTNVDL
ncbi:hypothetical protein K466DRAFT_599595 [Polyporus arcularius HHB13444]|uniref:Uncharacterized protein n=1 Tax=Polyporus arcularius HHB13444 TaxID=1314778 RepID=A0A5C3PC43_9APHY|nr:hypothetical protein K466DRAFT_599595 [Polyporus arcularius HHB13444]